MIINEATLFGYSLEECGGIFFFASQSDFESEVIKKMTLVELKAACKNAAVITLTGSVKGSKERVKLPWFGRLVESVIFPDGDEFYAGLGYGLVSEHPGGFKPVKNAVSSGAKLVGKHRVGATIYEVVEGGVLAAVRELLGAMRDDRQMVITRARLDGQLIFDIKLWERESGGEQGRKGAGPAPGAEGG